MVHSREEMTKGFLILIKSIYMKHTTIIPGGMLLMAAVAFASCADDKPLTYEVDKPASIADMEYLNEYDVLKNYVNVSASPNFRLGIALAAADYIAGGQVTQLANSNFVEMTAGNAMKYASCVADDGTMNFGTVESFVSAAQARGMTIYGHTLAWHSQQNNKYLNSLLKDREIEVDPDAKEDKQDAFVDYSTFTSYPYYVMGYTPEFEDGCMVSHYPGSWYQYFVADQITTTIGQTYKVTAYIQGSAPGSLNVQFGNWGNLLEAPLPFSDEWQEVSVEFSNCQVESSFVVFQPGTFEGDVRIKWLKVTHSEAPAVEIYTDIATNGNAEGTEATNFQSTHVGGSNGDCDIVDGVGVDNSRAFVVTSAGGGVNDYDTQFFLYADRPLVEGEVVHIAFDYRADVPNGPIASQAHAAPGSYIHWDAGCGITFTTEWQHFEKDITINATLSPSGNMQSIAWNLDAGAPSAPVNKYYFDNVKCQIVTKGNTIPLTPEEKKDTLTWAMNNWVEGMMQATGGYVTAWDVVNEAISGGGDDGEGFYTLQSASNVSPEDAANNFYWQDYLGNVDYVRIAVKAARKYYAENGGTAPLRLFVNDYNLESDWDDNKKVKSLVHWIEKWEADGETRIDGIGSQMHVSCYANADIQRSKEEHVVKMLEILAASGKLVKISELDMGYVDADGNSVRTENMTEAQHKAMAEYYKFIIKKYFEIIPAAQQYGITQWCATDAPSDSGWRGGEPVGLWDSHYCRKHTYAGFADGLAGK